MGKIVKKIPAAEESKVLYCGQYKLTQDRDGTHRLYKIVDDGFELLGKADSPVKLYEVADKDAEGT